MTAWLTSLAELAPNLGAIVLDQWGVLHDGTEPYAGAVDALTQLSDTGLPLAVLSNSGKRAAPNLARITAMGFPSELFAAVMTSGEALWQDIAAGRVSARRFFAIERSAGDAVAWADGLDVTLSDTATDAEAILLMGLPDGVAPDRYDAVLGAGLPIFCTNPDRASPRSGGEIVVSPGALAHAAVDRGAHVTFYGKPHLPVFRAVEAQLGVPAARLLMVGDSLEHDIAGGAAAGWQTAFVRGGLHADAFKRGALDTALQQLIDAASAPAPTYTLASLG
ncbi:MAG: TIGR01459 family HAD-type hydrolase [Pseudomonadota bacterium]